MRLDGFTPSRDALERVFRQKYGDPAEAGWWPRTSSSFGYFTPDEYYEAVALNLITNGCSWIDVGGGRDLFPQNRALATDLAGRCRRLVAVDPSDTVEENAFAHLRVKARLEDFACDETFDVASLRMVVEHVAAPEAFLSALTRIVRPRGFVIVYTVNIWSPLPIIAWLTPFHLHHIAKKFMWDTDEKDTYHVIYKMNTRARLRSLFERAEFRERHFAYLDDCRTFHRFRLLNYMELSAWRALRAVGLRYPESCLLGVYQRDG